jgi:hypothetical protein
MAAAEPAIPDVIQFVPCETVQRDLMTGLLTMTGVVGASPWLVDRTSYPTTFGRLVVYIVLTDVHGEFKFDVRLNPLSGARGGRQHCAVRATSPRDYCELIVPLGHWQIDNPGEYAIELLWRETPMITRRFTARHIVPRPPGRAEGGKGKEGPAK